MDDIDGFAHSTTHQSILIVGKLETTSGDYKNLLRRNFALYCAESSIGAISLIEQAHPIDLLLLEHRLPDRTWIEALKTFRNSRPTAPAIVVTASSSEETAITALRCGATDYIKEPCSTSELITRINSSLASFKRWTTSPTRDSDHASRHDALVGPANFRRALRFVNENYTLNLTLSQVADMACLSYYHFSKAFKKNLGVGFRDYINKKRIDRARELLVAGDRTITYIAHSVGFEDLTNFERVFKGLTSYTPSEYRNSKTKDDTGTKKAE